jgi:hypothetical protein
MFVEADGLVVITVKQAFAVEPGLIDESREVNIAP